MNQFGLAFHHLGLATTAPELAKRFLLGQGYHVVNELYDEYQKVNLIMCSHDSQPDIEIVFPADEKGPLDKVLSNNSAHIYHTCYTSKNVEASINQLKASGLRVLPIVQSKPAPLFNHANVSFYMVKGFGLIEVLEESI